MGKRVCIVGAGFSGAVIARELAERGIPSVMLEERSTVGGNCHTERCEQTGVMRHVYGPHIFHTDKEEVWQYVNRFAQMMPYVYRVKAVHADQVYSFPINLHTINQFFGKAMRPEEALDYIQSLAIKGEMEPENFEEQAHAMIGSELYEAFLEGYTRKQWGRSPAELPASILKRLPLRFTYEDNYFNHPYQAIPKEGYTALIENILDHELIQLKLNVVFDLDRGDWAHVFYTGPLDRYFNYQFGRLGYRSLEFVDEVHPGDYQGNVVINYSDQEVPYTRTLEHKHFAYWEQHEATLVTREYPKQCQDGDTPYYPIRLVSDKVLLQHYQEAAQVISDCVTFAGRLGTYRYLDMDQTIAEALKIGRNWTRD